MELGNVITLLTLLLTTILGVSDIKRRRAEARKLDSDSRYRDITADTEFMSQIKQASIDLMIQLKADNVTLREENAGLETRLQILEAKLEKCEKCLRELGKTCD